MFCAGAARASFMTQMVAKSKAGLHSGFAGSPALLDLCGVRALSAFRKAVAVQTSPLPTPPSLKFLPVVRSVCSLPLVAAAVGSAWAEKASWRSSCCGLHAV